MHQRMTRTNSLSKQIGTARSIKKTSTYVNESTEKEPYKIKEIMIVRCFMHALMTQIVSLWDVEEL